MAGDDTTPDRKAASLLWRVAVTLGFLVVVLTLSMMSLYRAVNRASGEIEANRLSNRRTRSAVCLSIYLDADRTFAMPSFCLEPEVAQFYPPEVCIEIEHPEGCGSRFGD